MSRRRKERERTNCLRRCVLLEYTWVIPYMTIDPWNLWQKTGMTGHCIAVDQILARFEEGNSERREHVDYVPNNKARVSSNLLKSNSKIVRICVAESECVASTRCSNGQSRAGTAGEGVFTLGLFACLEADEVYFSSAKTNCDQIIESRIRRPGKALKVTLITSLSLAIGLKVAKSTNGIEIRPASGSLDKVHLPSWNASHVATLHV